MGAASTGVARASSLVVERQSGGASADLVHLRSTRFWGSSMLPVRAVKCIEREDRPPAMPRGAASCGLSRSWRSAVPLWPTLFVPGLKTQLRRRALGNFLTVAERGFAAGDACASCRLRHPRKVSVGDPAPPH
eukprot:355915-Chlamydomonas_euryale.AAC.7